MKSHQITLEEMVGHEAEILMACSVIESENKSLRARVSPRKVTVYIVDSGGINLIETILLDIAVKVYNDPQFIPSTVEVFPGSVFR